MLACRGEQALDGRAHDVGELDDIEYERLVCPADVVQDVDAGGPAEPAAPEPPRSLEPHRPRIGDGDPRRSITVARVRREAHRLPGRTPGLDEDDRASFAGSGRVLET